MKATQIRANRFMVTDLSTGRVRYVKASSAVEAISKVHS